jgi:hypothetical protein
LIAGAAFQALLRKAFRDWAGTESEEKRIYVRNILTKAAASDIARFDVVKLEWIRNYSEYHFAVVTAIYNSAGTTRGGVWRKLGRPGVMAPPHVMPSAKLYVLIARSGCASRDQGCEFASSEQLPDFPPCLTHARNSHGST